MNWLQRTFHWIAEPRVQRVAFLVIYLMHVVAGIAIMFGQPKVASVEIGYGLTAAWGGFLAAGGLIGSVAVLPGWNFVERVAILAVLIGVALCSLVIIVSPWSDPGVQVGVWALVTGWLVVFALRSYEIRYYTVAPRIGG